MSRNLIKILDEKIELLPITEKPMAKDVVCGLEVNSPSPQQSTCQDKASNSARKTYR